MRTDRAALLDRYVATGNFVAGGLIALVLTYISAIEIGFQQVSNHWLDYNRLTVATSKLEGSKPKGSGHGDSAPKGADLKGAASNADEGTAADKIIKPTVEKTYSLTLSGLTPDASQAKDATIQTPAPVAELRELSQWSTKVRKLRTDVREGLIKPNNISLLGFSLTLPFKLVAAAWLAAAAALLIFTAHRRTQFYRALEHASDSETPAEDAGPPATLPVWLSPFPWRRGAGADQLKRGLDAGIAPRPFGPLLLILLVAAFLGFCVEVAAIGQEAATIYAQAAEVRQVVTPLRTRIGVLVGETALIISAAAAAGGAAYLLMSPVMAGASKKPLGDRRAAVFGGLAAAGFALATMGYRKVQSGVNARRLADLCRMSVRYRPRHPRRPDLSSGVTVQARQNPRSKVVHLILLSKTQKFSRLPPKAGIDRWPFSEPLAIERLDWSRRPYAIEQLALSRFALGGEDTPERRTSCIKACDFIIDALKHVSPRSRIRLQALAAGLAARARDHKRLEAIAKSAFKSDIDPTRARKWRNAALAEKTTPGLKPKIAAGVTPTMKWLARWVASGPLPWSISTERQPRLQGNICASKFPTESSNVGYLKPA